MASGQSSKANQRQGKAHKGGYNKYRNEFRWEKNKLTKVKRHLKAHPGDKVALSTIERVTKTLRGYA